MRNYIKDYISEIDRIINNDKCDDISKIIDRHLIKISFFSHERLIHFLVTFLFALLTINALLYTIDHASIEVLLLDFIFLCLLVPYIFHYYFLENSVQYMYKQYDKLLMIRAKK